MNARFAHTPWGSQSRLGSWLEKDPSRASSPAGACTRACTRACGARQAAGSMPAACPSLHPKNDSPRKAAGGAQAGRMAPPRRRARTQTVQWTVCAWRAAGRLRPARPARPGAEVGARTRALRASDSPRVFERNERSECSEFRGATSDRASQGTLAQRGRATLEPRLRPARRLACAPATAQRICRRSRTHTTGRTQPLTALRPAAAPCS